MSDQNNPDLGSISLKKLLLTQIKVPKTLLGDKDTYVVVECPEAIKGKIRPEKSGDYTLVLEKKEYRLQNSDKGRTVTIVRPRYLEQFDQWNQMQRVAIPTPSSLMAVVGGNKLLWLTQKISWEVALAFYRTLELCTKNKDAKDFIRSEDKTLRQGLSSLGLSVAAQLQELTLRAADALVSSRRFRPYLRLSTMDEFLVGFVRQKPTLNASKLYASVIESGQLTPEFVEVVEATLKGTNNFAQPGLRWLRLSVANVRKMAPDFQPITNDALLQAIKDARRDETELNPYRVPEDLRPLSPDIYVVDNTDASGKCFVPDYPKYHFEVMKSEARQYRAEAVEVARQIEENDKKPESEKKKTYQFKQPVLPLLTTVEVVVRIIRNYIRNTPPSIGPEFSRITSITGMNPATRASKNLELNTAAAAKLYGMLQAQQPLMLNEQEYSIKKVDTYLEHTIDGVDYYFVPQQKSDRHQIQEKITRSIESFRSPEIKALSSASMKDLSLICCARVLIENAPAADMKDPDIDPIIDPRLSPVMFNVPMHEFYETYGQMPHIGGLGLPNDVQEIKVPKLPAKIVGMQDRLKDPPLRTSSIIKDPYPPPLSTPSESL